MTIAMIVTIDWIVLTTSFMVLTSDGLSTNGLYTDVRVIGSSIVITILLPMTIKMKAATNTVRHV